MVDDLGLHTFERYAAAREQTITDQAEALLELSTPVIRLWDGIIAVPLIGTLDSARTQTVMEKMLDTLVATGAEHAVVDITGVPTVDTEVAQHLLKTVMPSGCWAPSAPFPVSGRRSRRPSCPWALSSATSPRRQRWRTRWPTHCASAGRARLTERVPIQRIGRTLLVSIQIDLQDDTVEQLREDLAEQIVATGATGVLIDITAVEIVDSFIGRMLSSVASMSRLFGAETVLVGMRPAVAITLVELGVSLQGVRTAINAEKGLRLLDGRA